jgi:UDP-N-acetylglucosamine--N-acetylmuramyl-(pentapeptide) pyrophosphoryl-undecaprenol N-acetylglucosamine transferase
VYPALAVLQGLNQTHNEILWIGSEGGMEAELVQRAGYPYLSIPAAGIHGVGLKALPGNLLRIVKGWMAARRILKDFSPDSLFFTGGYVSLPIALAGRKIPSLLFVPDIEPGLTVKFIARYASRIAISTAESLKYFDNKTKVMVTGYPTRNELANWTREEARKRFALKYEKRVLLVFGGSQGAQSINRALYPNLPRLLRKVQIIHLCGKNNWNENESEQAKLPADLVEDYHPFAYLHSEELGAAFQAADLVVSRAGAAVLGEFPQFNLPAILVPYPYAWRYQQTNAKYLESRGAAMIVQDSNLEKSLCATVFDLFDHPEQLETMGKAMRSLANTQAATTLSRLLASLGEKNNHRNGGLQ